MPPWFTADTRLGVLCLTLEPPACFMAEEYAANLGYTNVPDDCKVRPGNDRYEEHSVRCALPVAWGTPTCETTAR